MKSLIEDLKYALRMQRKRIGFTAVAVTTLALGIGANTAIFSIASAVLLQPLPYPDADRLVLMMEENRGKWGPVSYPNYVDWRRDSGAFEQMAAFRPTDLVYAGLGPAERTPGRKVSANFFATLGVRPALGRDFLPEDDKPGANRVAIVSHSFWQSRLNADPKAIGKAIRVNGEPYTVAGVLPVRRGSSGEFRFLGRAEIYVTLGPDAYHEQRWDHSAITVVARLKRGVSLEQAKANMDVVTRELERQYPKDNKDDRAGISPLRSWLTGGARRIVFLFLGAVGLVLLISCVNVANLLLARSAEREREFALRAALGAGRARVLRQLLTESVLMSLQSGAMGILLASWGVQGLISFVPEDIAASGVGIDVKVLGFSLLISLATGIVFGVAPALHASKADLNATLKEGRRSSSAGLGRDRLRSALVIAEVALSLVLLVGAGLLIRSAYRLLGVDPGFKPQNVLTFRLALNDQKIFEAAGLKDVSDPAALEKLARFMGPWQRNLLERMQRVPGVQYASTVYPLAVTGDTCQMAILPEGLPAGAQPPQAFYHVITPDYFRAMGTPLRRGRFFSDRDDFSAPRVAIVGETMAGQVWPGEDPVGKRFRFEHVGEGVFTVVGVVGDTKQLGLESPSIPQLYMSYAQWPQSMVAVVRTFGDPASMAPALRKAVAEWDREVPAYDIQPMEQRLADSLAHRRKFTGLLVVFAAIALVLTAVGIYSVMAYLVARQTREIGIRMALGATVAGVLRMVMGKALALAAIGATIGVAGALALTRLLSSLLFGVTATDPATFIAIAILLGLVSLAASAIPARRAARIDPISALRFE